MKLVEIVLDYPYYKGEEFCRQELEIAQDFFDEIYLITLSGHVNRKNRRYLPKKIKLIHARKKRYEIGMVLRSLFQILSIRTLREIHFAKKKLKVKESIKKVVLDIFIYYYYYNILDRVFKEQKFGNDCIFYSFWMAAPAYFLSRLKTDSFTITRTHGFDCFIDRGYQPFRREIIGNIKCIVSISNTGKNHILDKLGLFLKSGEERIIVSKLGIQRRNAVLNSVMNENNTLHIVSCSSINQTKRLDIIIDALSMLDINVQWTHIGSGELESSMREYAKKLDSKKNIVYEFKGWMNQEEIYEYYDQNPIDLFINSSDTEGIPVSIMEIMSYGIPVIARNVGGNSEIVNEFNGFLIEGNNISKRLADTIIKYTQLSKEDKRKMRESAFFMYDNEYRADKNYREFFCFIKSAANSGTYG